MEGEANRPANPHLAPSGTDQPTAPRRARRIRERAEQNRSSAAYRQGRLRTQPADHRAEQNADHHRVRAEQYISARKTLSATRFGDGTPERRQPTETNTSTSPPSGLHAYRPVNAPSGTRSRTRRAGASTGQPGVTRRAAGHHGVTEQQRPTTSQQTAPRQAQRSADHRAEQNADHHRVRPRTVHLGPKTPSAAQFGDGTPERRQCSATHRDEHLDEPTERTGPRILGTNQVEGTRSPPRTECPPYRPGAECCARGNPLVSITSTAVTVAPQRDQTRSFTHADPVNAPPAARCHVRAEWEHREDNPTHAPSSRPPRRDRAAALRQRLPPKDRRRRTNNLRRVLHQVEGGCQPPQEFGTWRRAARFDRRRRDRRKRVR